MTSPDPHSTPRRGTGDAGRGGIYISSTVLVVILVIVLLIILL